MSQLMPIYEYQCQACQEITEELQKINDEPLKKCPSCSKNKLKKIISSSAFRLKGDGWYETDFKSGNKKNGHANDNNSSNKNNSK